MAKAIKKMFSIGNGNVRAGVLILPDGYDAAKEYPLIVFFHGVGEAYYLSDTGPVDKIYANGCPLALARDGKLQSVTDLVTGKLYSPIVIGLQGIIQQGQTQGWCVSAQEMAACLRSEIFPNYKIDTKAIFVTGLSAGGQETHYSLSRLDTMDIYAAGVPLSAAASLQQNFDKMSCRIWGWHGADDKTCDPKNTTVYSADRYNAVHPGYYRTTIQPGVGHSGWDKDYDLNTRETVLDVNGKSYSANWAEWLMMNRKDTTFMPASQSTQTSQPNTTIAMTAEFTITAASNVLTLDPSKSTGSPTSFNWEFRSDAGVYVKPELMNGALFGNNKLPGILTVKLPNGKVNIILQLMYPGGKVEKSIAYEVGGLTQPPPTDPTPTKTIISKVLITTFSDGTFDAVKI